MARPVRTSGNKMSLRQTSFTVIHRVDFIASLLGPLGDMLSSTWLSIIAAITIGGLSIIFAIGIVLSGAGFNDFGGIIIPFVMIVIGSLLITLNILMVNPSQGSQLTVSLKYWYKELFESKKRYQVFLKPFAFSSKSKDRNIIEKIFDGKRYYFTIIKVQGKVSATSFDEDLQVLSMLNRDSLRALERDTQRTTIVYIGTPQIKPKKPAINATPAIRSRIEMLSKVVEELGGTQALETYIVLSARNYRVLSVKTGNQFKHLNGGLVTTAYQLKGDEAKKIINKLVG